MRFSLKNNLLLGFISFLVPLLWQGQSWGQTRFIENKGQWEDHIVAKAEIGPGDVYFEKTGITYNLWDKEAIRKIHNHSYTDSFIQYHSIKLKLVNANPVTFVEKSGEFETFYNYYLGNEPDKWVGGAKAFDQLIYYEIYPSIDLKIESQRAGFKYSFIVHPGGDPSEIKWQIEGADDIFLDNKRLKILNSLHTITEDAPYSYSEPNTFEEVKSSFLLDGNLLSYIISDYDSKRDLVIDPSVIFSSLSLSIADNWGYTATYDALGNGYTGGTVYGNNYPTTIGAYQRQFKGGPANDRLARDCGIYKLNEDGTKLIYMTFLGGRHNEQPHSLVVNSKNELIIFGTTESTNFPIQSGFQKRHGGLTDIFISKLSENGRSLIGSSFLGDSGLDGINGSYLNENSQLYRNPSKLVYNYGDLHRGEVIVDSSDQIYIASTTSSGKFPTTAGAYTENYRGGDQDAIVVKISEDVQTLVWSTFLGGKFEDAAYSLDLDEQKAIYVTGGTKSSDFPVSTNAYMDKYQGGMADAFVSKLSSDGSKLLNSTFIGTFGYDQGFFTKIGPDGLPYILGQTDHNNFPTVATTDNADLGIFITKFNKDLTIVRLSKKIGANGIVNISPSAFTVDLCGRVYFSGWGGLTSGNNSTGNTKGLKVTADAEQKTTDGRDFYVAVYTKDLATPIYATFFGGNDIALGSSSEHVDGGTSRFDKRGIVYQAICAACNGSNPSDNSRFPTSPNQVYGSSKDHAATTNCNNALVKIDLEGPAIYSEFDNSPITCSVPQTVDFTNLTLGSKQFIWKMGDGTSYTDSNVTHSFSKPGRYIVELISYNPIACNLRDTKRVAINIYGKSEADFEPTIDICTREVDFDHTGKYGANFLWDFGDGSTSDKKNPQHKFNKEGTFQISLITDDKTDCVDTFELSIILEDPAIDFSFLLDSCEKEITISNKSKGYINHYWDFGNGDSSILDSLTYGYSERGNYRLKLLINEGLSCEDSLLESIEFLDPEADFSFTIDTCLSLLTVENNSLDASSQKWILSDGRFFTDSEPDIDNFELDSTYVLSLIAAPYSICSDTLSKIIRFPGLPEALFSGKADTCISAIQFQNNSTNTPNFIWDFGDGHTSKNEHPFHNYRDTGSFLVSLIAYPNSLCADTFTQLIDVDTFRFGLFDVEIDTCLLSVQLNNLSEDLDSFSWRMGDGTILTDLAPSYVYLNADTFIIEMYGLKTLNGCRDTFSQEISFPPLPKAGFSYLQDSCLNSYIFSDSSLNGKALKWWATNGASSDSNIFITTFQKPKTYDISLLTWSEFNCLDTIIESIEVDSIPEALFDYRLDSCSGDIELINESYGGFRFYWKDHFNHIETGKNPLFTFTAEGLLDFLLVINKNTPCEDSLRKQIEIIKYQKEEISFTNIFSPNKDGANDVWEVFNLRPDCEDYELYIYDRWGVLIVQFQRDDAFIWDGKTDVEKFLGNNNDVTTGVYFYILKSASTQRHGTITLVR